MTKKVFNLWLEVKLLRRVVKKLGKEKDNLEHTKHCLLTALSKRMTEVRVLRKKTECLQELDFKLSQANASIEMYKSLLDEARKGVSLLAFTVPQSVMFMRPYYHSWEGDLKADASYAKFREYEFTSKMKIQMFDELLEKGFIKKYAPDNSCTRYEINVVRR